MKAVKEELNTKESPSSEKRKARNQAAPKL
jgi:hypothetical protein